MSRTESLREAESVHLEDGRVWWFAEHLDLTVDLVLDFPDQTLWADPISTMREVGIALVDETRTMVANTRRDRRWNHE